MKLQELATLWRDRAITSREEANRILRTIKHHTDAEDRCNARAEVWDKCADDLDRAIKDIAENTITTLQFATRHGVPK